MNRNQSARSGTQFLRYSGHPSIFHWKPPLSALVEKEGENLRSEHSLWKRPEAIDGGRQ